MRFYHLPGFKYFIALSYFVFSVVAPAFSQLNVSANYTAAALAARLAGPGVTILNPTLTCPGSANGFFVSKNTPISLDSGIILTTGSATDASGFESTLASTNQGAAGDASLASLANSNTYDACSLEFDLIPKGDTIKFQYQFGSEEYNHSTCGSYDDAFAFFISGPGIVGTENIAIIPGTTIPVLVNSVNSGIPGTDAGCALSNCTSVGPGSPFVPYYIDNGGGSYLTYKGFTDVFTAFHQVTSCDTYHLKIVIADAGNGLYDSGVFLKANSLKTNSFNFDRANPIGTTIADNPNTIVKGCAPATIRILNAGASAMPQIVYFKIGGSAVNGTDYVQIPDSVIIPAGDTAATLTIKGIPTAVTGTKTLHLSLFTTFTCGNADSISLNIIDTPSVVILMPDTTICKGKTAQLRANGTPGLVYSWSPAGSLNNPALMQPVANPTASTLYTMSATLPGAGCSVISGTVTVNIDTDVITLVSPDTSICKGSSVHIHATGPSSLACIWSPATGLSDSSIMQPVATPHVTTTYTVTTLSVSHNCPSAAQLTIAVGSPYTSSLKGDTVCAGQAQQFKNTFTTSSRWYFGDGSVDTTNTPSHIYTQGGSYNALLVITDTFYCSDTLVTKVVVDSMPSITFTMADSVICQGKSVPFTAKYTQDGNIGLQWIAGDENSTVENNNPVSFAYDVPGDFIVKLTASYRSCADTSFTRSIKVRPYPIINIGKDTSICPGAAMPITITDMTNATDTAASWLWSTGQTTPFITTAIPGYYYATVTIKGCTATDTIQVANNCYIDVPNVFTPNGDGVNDNFFPRSLLSRGIVSFSMSIYNRWGQEIFATNSTDGRGWDGKLNNVPQREGAYIYQIDAVFKDNEREHKQGTITLLR